MDIALIAAVAENRTIGKDGEIPWNYPQDLAYFRQQTLHHPVIMGRNTFESVTDRLDKPLDERINIVLTSRPESIPFGDADHVSAVTSLDEALRTARNTGTQKTFVAGGESVYRQFIDRASELIITEIPETVDGDTKFPQIKPHWEVSYRHDSGSDSVTFVHYKRKEQPLAEI